MSQQAAKKSYDLVIIGSGPGGISAAVQAAKLGKKVAIIEKSMTQIGGAWIHTGTIPSKTLRESLATIQSIGAHCGKQWVSRLLNDLSAEQLFGRAHSVAHSEQTVVKEYVKRNQIELLRGEASLLNTNEVCIKQDSQEQTIGAKFIFIATGSRPRRPDDIPFDGWRIVDSDDVLRLTHVPQSMIIYGAGVIGCEYACIFNALGTQVTLVDSRKTMMQFIDQEITNELREILESDGVCLKLGEELDHVETDGPGAQAVFKSGLKLYADVLFFAAGRVSNSENLGLEKININISDRGCIEVDKSMQTAIKNIYAFGDVIGPPALAATSSEQGRRAAMHAFSSAKCTFPDIFPVGIYTIPEMSSVGLIEKQIKEQNIDYVTGRAYFKEVARGYIRGDSKGLVKIHVNKETHEILGIHMVGPDSCNLIHTGLSIMLFGGTVHDFIDKFIYNYPTLSEVYRIAAFNALNKIFPNGIFEKPMLNRRKDDAA